MPQTPGVADHAAPKPTGPTSPSRVLPALQRFLTSARKAWIAFLVAGGASAIAQNVATLNFSGAGLRNLWQGLIGGVVTAFFVYWITNDMRKYDSSIGEPTTSPPTTTPPSTLQG